MVQRSELEKILSLLGDDLNRMEREDRISYRPAEKRLSIGVIEPLQGLRSDLKQSQAIAGPSLVELQTVGETMVGYIDEGEFDLALDSFKALADSLDLVKGDKEREELTDWLRQLEEDATTLRDFELIELTIGGFAIHEGRDPVIIIDGTRRSVGDLSLIHI